MLWLGLYFPQLPLEVFERARQQGGAFAVVSRERGREQISRCNAAAATYGIQPGLALPAALALHAGLAVRARDEARETQALQELAAWAYQFSARLAFEPSLLLLEVGASARLFGGVQRLLDRVVREAGQLGYSLGHALAPTPTAAGLLARRRPGCQVLDRAGLAEQVGDIPLRQLTRDAGVRALMQHIGLTTIGDALALPRAELIRRTGPALALLLDRLLGVVPDPRDEWQPPRRFTQRIELLGEIERSTALCGFLRGHGGGAQGLQWCLEHRDRPESSFEQGLLDPSRDADHMLEVFRERIERLELQAPVVAIRLRVDDWLTFEERSLAMFDAASRNDHALLERLGNRLGEQRVRSLRCRADHRPERAWQLCTPGDPGADFAVAPASLHHRAQPPWLLAQPRPLTDEAGQPVYGGVLRLEQPPQRIEAGWWDGGDITRDYFVAHSVAGERLWVFQDRRSGSWYLHGLFT